MELSNPTVFKVESLIYRAFWDIPEGITALFGSDLEGGIGLIADEFQRVRREGHPLARGEPITTKVRSGDWTALHMLEEGVWCEWMCGQCPRTFQLLQALNVCDCRYRSLNSPSSPGSRRINNQWSMQHLL